MKMSVLIYVVFLFGINVPVLSYISDACRLYKVVPDIIPHAPLKTLSVVYPHATVFEGNRLMLPDVSVAPNVTWTAKPNSLYTLIMIDADVPYLKVVTMQILHWLVVNIPGSAVEEGSTITPYSAPRQTFGDQLRRYIFLVYQQRYKSNDTRWDSPAYVRRSDFKVKEFAEKNGLGVPVYGNFFRAEPMQLGLSLRMSESQT